MGTTVLFAAIAPNVGRELHAVREAAPLPIGGTNFTIRDTPTGPAMTWTDGGAESGYLVYRLLPTVSFSPVLAATATSYTDATAAPSGFACYTVIPLGNGAALGYSDLLCVFRGTATGAAAGRATNFRISLDHTTTASLTWTNPTTTPAGHVLFATVGPSATLTAATTSRSIPGVNGFTCFNLASYNAN